VLDLDRATAFYTAVLGCTPTRMPSPTGEADVILAMFGCDGEQRGPGGALIQGTPLEPSTTGTVLYFGTADLAASIDRAVAAGGSLLVPRTAIGPHGFFAHILDSEGNRIGLHSMS
ncbi:MAG: VOC family protein, partial [Rhodospirillaceae bacterium]